MAKLSFIRGAVTGRLGEFVGSKWKGINYIRLYKKPSNPNTEKQASVREVFKKMSHFANAVFAAGFNEDIPPAKQMTERNSIFKANAKMFTDKQFIPMELQICIPNFRVGFTDLSCKYDNNGKCCCIEGDTVIASRLPDSTKFTVNAFVYDFITGAFIGSDYNDLPASTNGHFQLRVENLPPNFTHQNKMMFVYLAAVDENNKMLFSNTANTILSPA